MDEQEQVGVMAQNDEDIAKELRAAHVRDRMAMMEMCAEHQFYGRDRCVHCGMHVICINRSRGHWRMNWCTMCRSASRI